MILDTEKNGMDALFKPYVAKLLQYMWDKPAYIGAGISNSELHMWYNKYARNNNLPSKSIATIVKETKKLEKDGILSFYEVTGKGGYARMYYPMMAPQGFSMYVKDLFTEKLDEMFTGPWWTPKSHQSAPTAKTEEN